MLDTFKNSSAERVPSECSQARYIADIFQKDMFIAGSDILPIYWCLLSFDHGLVVSLVPGFQMQGQISGAPTILDLASLPVARVKAEFTKNIAPVHISTCHPEVEELPGGALHAVKNRLRINKTSSHVICAEVG